VGITGSADTIIVLKREPNDPKSLLHVRGGDVVGNDLALKFDDGIRRSLKFGKGEDVRISEGTSN